MRDPEVTLSDRKEALLILDNLLPLAAQDSSLAQRVSALATELTISSGLSSIESGKISGTF